MSAVVPIEKGYKGSRVLAQWNAERRAEKAVRDQAARYRQFAGAAVNRLTASMAQWSGSINADLDNGLAILRARARGLCANNEFGRRFLTMVGCNVVGPTGPSLQVRAKIDDGSRLDTALNSTVESHFERWCQSADITGRMSFAHLLRVAVMSVARDGESLVRFVRSRDLPYGLGLQLLEADRLDEQLNRALPSGNSIRMGVELTNYGRPIAYYVKTAHPGDNQGGISMYHERVPATDMLHSFLVERAEQTRGYTWLHAVLIRMNMLHGFEEAAVIAARVGASKMGVFTRSLDADPAGAMLMASGEDASGLPQMSAEPGEFFTLPAGYDLKTWDPDYPHQNFESFLKACMRGVAMGLNVATHNLSGDMTDVNYSSARIAELAERDVWKMLQHWLIDTVVKPIYREWLRTALASGQLTFSSGLTLPPARIPAMYEKLVHASHFQPRTWSWVDPLKDVQAAKEEVSLGITSRTRLAQAQGVEFEDIVAELAFENEALKAAGVLTEAAPPPQQTQEPPPSED